MASVEVQLTAGRWRVHSDVKCYYRFGATGVAAVLATTADGHPLPADVLDYKTVDDPNTNGYVSLICDSGDTGTVTFSEQEDR